MFIEAAVQHASIEKETEIFCPCRDCKNEKLWRDTIIIKSHLVRRGFVENYTRWTKHGESLDEPVDEPVEEPASELVNELVDYRARDFDEHGTDPVEEPLTEPVTDTVEEPLSEPLEEPVSEYADFDVEELLFHVEPQVLINAGTTRGLDNFAILQKASKDLLYEESMGCTKDCTVLRTVLELMKLKALHGWSDTSFTDLL